MPRPKPITKKDWIERQRRQQEFNDAALRRAHMPTCEEIGQDVDLATKLVGILGFPRDRRRARIDGLTSILIEARREWQERRAAHPDLPFPILGEIRPTRGEMRVTLTEGLELAKKLRGWYQALPEELLFRADVQFAEGPIPLGVVIERLAETLEALTAAHKPEGDRKPQGRPPGRREASQAAARYLILFIDKHAANAPSERRRKFVFQAMRGLAIDCPDLNVDPSDFTTWLAEVEDAAKSYVSPT